MLVTQQSAVRHTDTNTSRMRSRAVLLLLIIYGAKYTRVIRSKRKTNRQKAQLVRPAEFAAVGITLIKLLL